MLNVCLPQLAFAFDGQHFSLCALFLRASVEQLGKPGRELGAGPGVNDH